MEWLAVINPASGGGKVKKKWAKKIKQHLKGIIKFKEYYTTGPSHAIDYVRQEINHYDGFIAVGGDGTSNEVINGIVGGLNERPSNTKIFAVIPAGTGNDIAHAFDLPYDDIHASCDIFKNENSIYRMVDVGKASGFDFENKPVTRYFCGVLSAGFDAEVTQKTHQSSSCLPGTAKYVRSLLSSIIRLSRHHFSVSILNQGKEEKFKKEGIFMAVGLGQYYGAGMKICPDAKVDDGIFHITFLNRVSRGTLLRVFPKVYDGGHIIHPAIDLYTGPKLSIQGSEKTIWQVDGEILGHTPVKIETLPKVLKILSSKTPLKCSG